MGWALLVGLTLALGIACLAMRSRRAELERMRTTLRDRDRAAQADAAEARLQHPVIDLTRCLGCATCVAVCPEDGVLAIAHGQATVVNGSRCVGISACERECPVGAITVTLANLEHRRDVPALEPDLEAVGSPGLFLAGEVTAHALIKSAIEQGASVGREVARRVAEQPPADGDRLDLCIVGAGPAGLACSLEAKRLGLRFVTIDQADAVGGTVATYPRRKLVMTQPVELPLHGRLDRASYSKEELMALWQDVAAAHALPIEHGTAFSGVERSTRGGYRVHTDRHAIDAEHVCLALGRRGLPRRLDVPGETLPKVVYSLVDAQAYSDRRILVVGGGDSAVETAVALSEQPGNRVTLSYRRDAWFRIRSRNEEHLAAAVARGTIDVVLRSRVVEIRPDAVELEVDDGDAVETRILANDDVFVMIGGVPPHETLERSGVSFDPTHRTLPAPVVEQGTGLRVALWTGFVLALVTLAWTLLHADYYFLELVARPTHDKHDWLRPGRGLGLALGIASVSMIVVNLLYLLRRAPGVRFTFGSLKTWMTSHVATGILALLCALVHGAMAPGDTPGGHAFWALGILLVTGAIGRYFYAYVPRAANGRELELSEVKHRLSRVVDAWPDADRAFHRRAQDAVEALVERRRWHATFFGRVAALLGGHRDIRRLVTTLRTAGKAEGIPAPQIEATVRLARSAHRTAVMVAHFEDLRALLGSWRYFHRWVAAGLVLLVVIHVVHALVYGSVSLGGGR